MNSRILISVLWTVIVFSIVTNAKAHDLVVNKARSENKKITKIVALAPHLVEMLYAIGAEKTIIATTDFSDYPASAKNIPRVGGYHGVQIERIVEMEPDLIMVWKSGNKQQDIDKLEKLGLPIYYSKPTKIDDVPSEILAIGKLLDKNTEALKVANDFRQKVIAIKNKYSKKKTVHVFYQLWFEPMRTVGPGSWMQQLIEFCGAKNVFDNAFAPYPLISLESVIEKKPEVFIIPTHHGKQAQTGTEKYWDEWQEIPAVRKNHMFQIDGDVLHRYSPRMLAGMQTMCEKIDLAR
jgi:vitamin B12 transport system substrate-binding protein